MSIETMVRHISKVEARTALDHLDDYARMANINPIGARGVLEQFIEQVETIEVSCRGSRLPYNPDTEVSHN